MEAYILWVVISFREVSIASAVYSNLESCEAAALELHKTFDVGFKDVKTVCTKQ